MIAAMALRLLYLIFSRLLDSLTLLSRASASKNLELLVQGRGRQDRAVSLSPPETPPAERRPTRPFKGANRGPTSRYHVRLARTRDRLRVARLMATERS